MQNFTLLIILFLPLQLKASKLDINRLNQELNYLETMAKRPLFFFGESKSKDEVKLSQSGVQKTQPNPDSLINELNTDTIYRDIPPNAEEVKVEMKNKNKLRRGR